MITPGDPIYPTRFPWRLWLALAAAALLGAVVAWGFFGEFILS
jgi:hypothetical protein